MVVASPAAVPFAMLPHSPLQDCVILGLLIVIIFLVIAIARRQRWDRTSVWSAVVAILVIVVLIGLLVPPVARVTEAAAKTQTMNSLRQIAIAMHTYADRHDGRLPPAAVFSKDGKPLLSWRVLLLPYLDPEEKELYGQFKLDEPWDSPHNLPLLKQMPFEYAHPAVAPTNDPRTTHFRVFVGKGTAFAGTHGLHLKNDFTLGTANTILVVEAAEAVPWTKPDELPYAADQPLPVMANFWKDTGFCVVQVDCSVGFIKAQDSEAELRKAIVRIPER